MLATLASCYCWLKSVCSSLDWNAEHMILPSKVTRNHVLTFVSPLVVFLRRYTNALRPAGHQAKGLCRLQPENQGPLPAEGPGQVLARRLPQVRLLRLPSRRGGLHAVHQSQPHPLSEGLPTVRGKTHYLYHNTHSRHYTHKMSLKTAESVPHSKETSQGLMSNSKQSKCHKKPYCC